jgi:LmbE family N-acetylglucosaminyl deacetylase/ActR/RegA family two-component response regulator
MNDSRQSPVGPPARILFVEDDELFAAVAMEIVGPLAAVRWVASAEQALDALRSEDWDLVIADVNLPGMSGLELARVAKRVLPDVTTLILTGSASLDTAVGALRSGADEFLTKPVDGPALAAKVVELTATARGRKADRRAVVLAIGAHPDDVEIGAGGILLRHAALGDEVNILTLTGGEVGGVVSERALESQRAAELMSARLFLADLADTRVSVSDGGIAIGTIERVIAEIKPSIVYTHSLQDVHQDHRNVHHATLVAARNVPHVYCYQAPSANIEFRPTRFVAVDEWMDDKLDVIAAYGSQVKVRRYLQPDLLRATARYWSRFGSSGYAEPLEVVRDSESTPVPAEASTPEPQLISNPQPVLIEAHVP